VPASSREFWACPCFAAPAGAVLRGSDPGVLAGQMRRLQRAVVDELLAASSAVAGVEDSAVTTGSSRRRERGSHDGGPDAIGREGT
jgi:hypothetical protein